MATSVVTALKKSIQIRSRVVLIRHSQIPVPDPDLEIRGVGGGVVIQTLRASVWSKNEGGWAPRAPPLDPPLIPTPFEGN